MVWFNRQKPLQETVQLSGPHIDRRNEEEQKATDEKVELGNIHQIITQQNKIFNHFSWIHAN
jgi:hypothetical protein